MNQMVEEIKKYGIVPVVVLNDVEKAVPLAQALIDGGLPCAEITFRTDAAEESIRRIAEKFPGMLVGAGTVLSVEQVNRAVAAGARFIVSPGFDPEVVDYCIENGIPVLPGCVTPSEVIQGVKRGLKVLKFFPAESFGGLSAIKAIGAAFPGLKFMPTGGISRNNLQEYLKCDKILACGGSFMVKNDMIEAGKFEEIAELTRQSVELVRAVRC